MRRSTSDPAHSARGPALPLACVLSTMAVLALAACDGQEPVKPAPNNLFATHPMCTGCHQQMVDAGGNDVSLGRAWSSTMMANALRDPYYQATVRREVLTHPALGAVIQDKCTRCHAPMAHVLRSVRGLTTGLLDDGVLSPAHPQHALAMDGVSCTLCHQIDPTGIGAAESFSGGFAVDTERPRGERALYGPEGTTDDLATRMARTSGFRPVASPHLQESALCATCHTLFTPFLDDTGAIAGEFPEQTAFLEWGASAFVDRQSCQGCHQPEADGAVTLSVVGGEPRAPFRRHDFVGGNRYVPRLLDRHRASLGVTATSEAFAATIARTEAQLRDDTATLDATAVRSGDELVITVSVSNLVGHKYPTGFPSRRAWLHLQVTDDASLVVFESGAPRPDGSIEGNDNDALAGAYEPHYLEITQPDQVQIYEAILGDVNSDVTTVLLRAAGYLKDNRLQPEGFSATSDDPDIGIRGAAAGDPDFGPGGDRLIYRVPLGARSGPFTIRLAFLYQSIAHRWALNLRDRPAYETYRFVDWYQADPELPAIVGETQFTVSD